MYEGEFGSKGQPSGYGRYIDGQSSYTGYWSDGIPQGTGWYTVRNKSPDEITVPMRLCTNKSQTKENKAANVVCVGNSHTQKWS